MFAVIVIVAVLGVSWLCSGPAGRAGLDARGVRLALTAGAVFVLRRGEVAPAYRMPGYPLTPVVFLVLVAVLLVLLVGHNPVQAALGAGIVGLGVTVYFVAFRRRTTSEGTAPHDLDSNDPVGRSG